MTGAMPPLFRLTLWRGQQQLYLYVTLTSTKAEYKIFESNDTLLLTAVFRTTEIYFFKFLTHIIHVIKFVDTNKSVQTKFLFSGQKTIKQ
jgi:hypothetical protein